MRRRWRQDELPGLWVAAPPPVSEERLPFPVGLPASVHLAEIEQAARLAKRGRCKMCGGLPLVRGFDHRRDCPISMRGRRQAGETVPSRGSPSCAWCAQPRDSAGRIEHAAGCRVLIRRDTCARAA